MDFATHVLGHFDKGLVGTGDAACIRLLRPPVIFWLNILAF